VKVLAIDPGPSCSALVLWNGTQIVDHKYEANELMLLYLHSYFNTITPINSVAMVIEQVKSYGMAVGETIFDTVFWSGRFYEAWNGSKFLLPRLEVKMHLCHDSKAKDTNIRQALRDRFGEPFYKEIMMNSDGVVKYKAGINKGKPKMVTLPNKTYDSIAGDEWAAFALAVTWYDTKRVGGNL